MIPNPAFPVYWQQGNKQLGIKQLFSPHEDDLLRYLVSVYGDKDWKLISKQMPNRTTRQCRERYKNYLAPQIKNGAWTEEEDKLLRQKYAEYGPKWSKISTFFKSRSDVNIKNHWNTLTNHIPKTPKFKVYLVTSLNHPTIDNQDINSPISPPQPPTENLTQSHSPNSPSSAHLFSDALIENGSPPQITSPIQKSHHITVSPHDISPSDGKFHKDHPLSLRSHSVIRLQSTNLVQTPSFISQLNKSQQNVSFTQSDNHSLSTFVRQVTPNQTSSSTSIATGSNLNSILNHDESKGYSQVNSKKKQPFPPISSLSQNLDDKAIADRVFLSNETKMDETLLSNPQNIALTNTFPNYGGSVW